MNRGRIPDQIERRDVSLARFRQQRGGRIVIQIDRLSRRHEEPTLVSNTHLRRHGAFRGPKQFLKSGALFL